MSRSDLPADVKWHLHDNAPNQLCISTVRFGSDDNWPSPLLMRAGGISSSYSHALVPLPTSSSSMEKLQQQSYPELAWMHELLHEIVNFYTYQGYPMPDIHQPADYGFPGLNGYGSYGNEEFYRAFLAGKLYDAAGTQVGVTAEMWADKPAGGVPKPNVPNPNPEPTPKPDNGDGGGGGGGCQAGFASISLLALVLLRRQRRC